MTELTPRQEVLLALKELQEFMDAALAVLNDPPSTVEELTETRRNLLLVEDRARFARAQFDDALLEEW